MPEKRYISLTGIQYTFPVKVKNKVEWVSLSGNLNDYSTSDSSVQEAIEKTKYFTDKKIGCVAFGKLESDRIDAKKGSNPITVEGIQEAREILNGKYGVDLSKLITPDEVIKTAEKLGVSFDIKNK